MSIVSFSVPCWTGTPEQLQQEREVRESFRRVQEALDLRKRNPVLVSILKDKEFAAQISDKLREFALHMKRSLHALNERLDEINKELNTQLGGNPKGFKDAKKINELLRLKKNAEININQEKQKIINQH